MALSLLDDPEIVLLDEPTTSMDPRTRRLVWSAVLDTVRAGRSVVLTSHSMEECDALCTRLAIMVNGRLRCLGNPQHIKNKYGSGYTIMVRCKGANNVAPMLAYMRHHLGSQVALVDRNLDALELRVAPTDEVSMARQLSALMLAPNNPKPPCQLGQVFDILERAKSQLEIIIDYSVSQTTLDQIFVNFARHQLNSDQKQTSNGKKSSKKKSSSSEKGQFWTSDNDAGAWFTADQLWKTKPRKPRRRMSSVDMSMGRNFSNFDSRSTTSSSAGSASPPSNIRSNRPSGYSINPMQMPSLQPPDVAPPPQLPSRGRPNSHQQRMAMSKPRH